MFMEGFSDNMTFRARPEEWGGCSRQRTEDCAFQQSNTCQVSEARKILVYYRNWEKASVVKITVELRVELDEVGKAFVDLIRSLDLIFVEWEGV